MTTVGQKRKDGELPQDIAPKKSPERCQVERFEIVAKLLAHSICNISENFRTTACG